LTFVGAGTGGSPVCGRTFSADPMFGLITFELTGGFKARAIYSQTRSRT
jgi:hypothetical protein